MLTPAIIKAELEIPAGALMVFQLLVTLAFGALGLLLAVPIFVVLLVLVREIYAYDLLGLRHTTITISTNARGECTRAESTADPAVSAVDLPAAKPVAAAQPRRTSEKARPQPKRG